MKTISPIVHNRRSLPKPKGIIRFEIRGDELFAQGKSLGKVIFRGVDGKDYELTKEDQQAIAELAAKRIPTPKDGENGKPYRPTKALKKSIAEMIPVPKDGTNYALTDEDRAEIANLVPPTKITPEIMERIAELVEAEPGQAPEHEIRGTDLRFKNPDGTWGDWLKFRIVGGSMSAGAFIVKFHDELNGVTGDQHHNKSHSHDGADGSGTVAHSNTTGLPWSESGHTIDADVDFAGNCASDVGCIDFNLTQDLDGQEGRVYWDADNGTLAVGLPGGKVTLQVGQEGVIRVRNDSGSDISNGQLVCATGAQGQKLTIDLADNTDADTIQILGMATENIDDNSNGYVALWGTVRGDGDQPIDTSTHDEGTKLYLNAAGGWTATHPTNPTYATIVIGIVERKHAILGEISLQFNYFTIGNSFDGTMRQSIINKNTGTSAAVGFTAVNNSGHFATFGIGGTNNTTFPDVTVFYGPGYNDNYYACDGNKSHKWFNDPEDRHNNGSLEYLNMELDAAGTLSTLRGGRIVHVTEIDHTDSPYTVLAADRVVICDTDGGAITLNLPAGVSGTNYKLVNAGSAGNYVTADPNGTEQLYGGGAGVSQEISDGEVMNIHYSTKGWW